MSTSAGEGDPYVYPGTDVLVNRLDERDPAVLCALEADLSATRLAELARTPIKGAFDLAHLQTIHRKVFGDLYPWAGEIRQVATGKQGVVFTWPDRIREEADRIFGVLHEEQCLRGLSRLKFVQRMAHHYQAVYQLHPFREGNSRTRREFFRELAADAGYVIRWPRMDAGTLMWESHAKAHYAAVRGDIAPLERWLSLATTDAPGVPSMRLG